MGLFKSNNEEILFSNDTVIEHGMVVDAVSLSGSCGLVVRGIVKAAVDVDADVFVDASGTIEGPVTCTNCKVMGRIKGDVSAAGFLFITNDGCVEGDIMCNALQIDNGGIFRGTCNKVQRLDTMVTSKPKLYVQKEDELAENSEFWDVAEQ